MEKFNINNNKENISKGIIRILKGCLISFVITIILIIIFALLLTYTQLPESTINTMIIVITGLSILIGSSISTIKIKKNGIINGGIIGLLYIFFLYLLSGTAGAGFSFNIYSIILFIVAILTGMIGGIVGVNIK